MGVNMKCENWHSDPPLVALNEIVAKITQSRYMYHVTRVSNEAKYICHPKDKQPTICGSKVLAVTIQLVNVSL